MGRTIRQRQTIQRIVQKAKTSGLTTIFNMMDEVFPYVQTSLTKNEILQMLPSMVSYALDDTTGFPMDYKFSNARGSIIVATDLVSNVEQLHKFLYGDDIEYTPTAEVQEYSDKILEIVGGEDNLETEQTVTEDDENTDNDNFIWNEGDDYLNNYTPSNSDYDYSEGGGDSYGGGSDNSDGDGDFYGGGDDYDYSSGGGDSYGGGDDYSSGGGDSYGGGDDYSSGGDSYGGGDDYSSGGDSYGGEDIPSVGGEEETSSYSAEPTGIADDQEE
jgi:hypothetical protein